MATTFAPAARAADAAFSTFGLLPEVLSAHNTSPGPARASTCRLKTSSYE